MDIIWRPIYSGSGDADIINFCKDNVPDEVFTEGDIWSEHCREQIANGVQRVDWIPSFDMPKFSVWNFYNCFRVIRIEYDNTRPSFIGSYFREDVFRIDINSLLSSKEISNLFDKFDADDFNYYKKIAFEDGVKYEMTLEEIKLSNKNVSIDAVDAMFDFPFFNMSYGVNNSDIDIIDSYWKENIDNLDEYFRHGGSAVSLPSSTILKSKSKKYQIRKRLHNNGLDSFKLFEWKIKI